MNSLTNIKTDLLLEASRDEVNRKSKKGRNYVPYNQHKGKNRWERRLHQKVSNSVDKFNEFDMDKFFNQDTLDLNIEVKGETDTYTVRISFKGVLAIIQKNIDPEVGITLRLLTQSITKALNQSNDIKFDCDCPDFYYRFSYQATKNKTKAGKPQTIAAPITNPHDDLGGGCKHVNMVLSNRIWVVKIAAVLYNYINYMEKHDELNYENIIYPAIYGTKSQLTFDIDDTKEKEFDMENEPPEEDEEDDSKYEIKSDKDKLDISNKYARTKNYFQKGNEFRFRPKEEIQGQKSFDFDKEISDK